MVQYADVAVIILAAGKGTRMKSDLAKVLHPVDGKSMVVHVIDAAAGFAADHIHVVVGHQADKVKQEINQYYDPDFAIQEQLLGTGDAVKTALPGIDPDVKHVLVLCGDVPLIQTRTLIDLVESHIKNQSQLTVLATRIDQPKGYGRIITDNEGQLLCIREEADADEKEKQITLVNTGIYCFDRKVLADAIELLRPDNNQAEYYLTDVIEIVQKKDGKTMVVTMDDSVQVMGVNTLEELASANELIHGN